MDRGLSLTGRDLRASGELPALVLDVLRQTNHALTPGEVRCRFVLTGVSPLAYTTAVTTLPRLHVHGIADRWRRAGPPQPPNASQAPAR